MNIGRHELIMAVFPNTRGFAYVVFEGPIASVDWGMVELRGKGRNRGCLRRVAALLGRWQPNTLVLQDMSPSGTLRASRIRRINQAIALLAEAQDIGVMAYSREQVREGFAAEGFPTKQRIAEAIAKRIPMFERLLPPPRKLWDSEHPRMGIFDAVALVLTFYRGST